MFLIFSTQQDNFSFLKDLLPVLISSLSLALSVGIPFLIIRYEKAFQKNQQYKDFLRKMDIFLLDWLNISSENENITKEFIEALQCPEGIFVKDFRFYGFPSTDVFDTYNIDILNESYDKITSLKSFNHHLKLISSEYIAYRSRLLDSKDSRATNGSTFFLESLNGIKDQFPKIKKDLMNLRVLVRLLLKEVNRTPSLTIEKFFSINPNKMLWYKKDIKFAEIDLEKERKEMAD